MITAIDRVALLVRDYDEAKRFYCDKLGFAALEDTALGAKRWVRLRAAGGGGCELVLSKAEGEAQRAGVGKQAGGRVLFFMRTDDFDSDFARMTSGGVEFTEAPREESYGKVAVFKDLYGNRIDLIGPAKR